MFIVIFIVAQLINVVVSTFKSVLTIRGTKVTAAFINAIAYSINILIVYLVSREVGLLPSIIVTFSANLIGVYAGLTILEYLRRDEMWRISTTIKNELLEDYKEELKSENVKFIQIGTSDFSVIDIFSHTKEETSRIKPILRKYNVKYTAYSSKNVF